MEEGVRLEDMRWGVWDHLLRQLTWSKHIQPPVCAHVTCVFMWGFIQLM